MNKLKKINKLFWISIFFIFIIILFLFLFFIINKNIESFDTSELDSSYKKLLENRKEYQTELDKQYDEFRKTHKGELDNFIHPRQIKESKIQLSDVNYADTIKNFYVQEKADQKEKEAMEEQQGNIYNLKQYKQLMLDNNKEKLFKKTLNNIKILKDECFEKCDQSNCIKLDQQAKILKKCLTCNKQKNKCFNKTIIGGQCDDCDGVDIKDKFDCLSLVNFGCPNPENLDNAKGVEPYYFLLNNNSPTSPFNKKCVFCWQINSEI